MFTRTTATALMALLFIAGTDTQEPISRRRVAQEMELSPSYLAKILTLLSRAKILTPYRGMLGGVALLRRPAEITLLEVVRACQGELISDGGMLPHGSGGLCDFHQAISEIQQQIHRILSAWTLADLASNPCPRDAKADTEECRLADFCPKRRFPAGDLTEGSDR